MTNEYNENHLGYVRIFYRTHLAKYALFRRMKPIVLALWWPLRNAAIMVRTLARPRMFYRSYLARYRIFRVLKILLFSIFFSYSYSKFFFWLRFLFTPKKQYHLIPMSIYVVERGVEVILINAAGRLNVPGPKFIRFNGTALDCSDVVSLKIPRIEIAEMKDMTVFGGGSWLLSPDKAIYPDLLVPERDVTLSEVEGPVSVDLSSGSVSIKHSSRPKKIPYAVSLLGQCSGNYAHWLTEILPKLLIIDSVERFKNFPLLVDEWVHPNFLKQINLLGVYDRAIILVGRWECVSINSLIEISPPAYLSAESREYLQTRSLPRPDSDLYPFSKHSLDMLRSAALRVASKYKSGNPKKLYLRRSAKSVGNGRMIINMAEVESLILSYGFEALDPAELSVVDQMAVFRDAECIISPVGAALANAIFTPAGCKVIALAPYYENANYYYYSNLMGVLGHDLHYVLGPQVEMDGHVLHRNYSIDLDALKEALERLAK